MHGLEGAAVFALKAERVGDPVVDASRRCTAPGLAPQDHRSAAYHSLMRPCSSLCTRAGCAPDESTTCDKGSSNRPLDSSAKASRCGLQGKWRAPPLGVSALRTRQSVRQRPRGAQSSGRVLRSSVHCCSDGSGGVAAATQGGGAHSAILLAEQPRQCVGGVRCVRACVRVRV